MSTVHSGVLEGSQLPVPYITCSPRAGVGLAGWEPGLAAAWAREPLQASHWPRPQSNIFCH